MSLAPSFPPSIPPSDDCNRPPDYADTVKYFVFVAVLGMFLLHILGSIRRQSGHGLLHAILVGIDAVSYPLVSYTIGLMQSTGWYYNDFTVWAVFLLLLLCSSDNLTACRLNDIDNWKSIYVKHLFKGFLLIYLVVRYGRELGHLLLPLSAIMLVGVLKWYVRIASMTMVSKSHLYENVKVIDGYMEMELPDDNRPVAGNVLLGELGNKLKDVCLSMKLSKMLNRRFAGFNLSEGGHDQTRDNVFEGLLNAHQRAFMVIEQELVFIHDTYYTRYSYLYQKGPYLALCFPLVMIGLCSWLALKSLSVDHKCGRNPNDELNAHYCSYSSLHYTAIVTVVVLAFLEAYQLYLYIASGWFKVALIRSYVTTPFLQRKGCWIVGLLLRLKAFPPWKNKLGQYCILRDLGRNSKFRNCLHYATLGFVDKKKGKKRCKNSVKVSENLKQAIVNSLLQSNNGRLTNGIESLRRHGVDGHFSWACYSNVTHTIIVWHIATTMCEHQLDANLRNDNNVVTACTLSRYFMHLLVFAPQLLPDHISISEPLLNKSIDEACQRITKARAKTMEARCEALNDISTPDDDLSAEGSLVTQGARLAKDLYLLDVHREDPTAFRWMVLLDFWAEMMLYVSLSDDAQAHLELLAKGGEFITHLWALLTHAVVLKREPTEPREVV